MTIAVILLPISFPVFLGLQQSAGLPVYQKTGKEHKKDEKYHTGVKNSLRIWPQDNDTEGFFVCKIKKNK